MKPRSKMQTRKQLKTDSPPAPTEQRQWRAATVESIRADGDAAPTITMSVSSELPVLTMCRVNGEYVTAWEILDHKPASINRARMGNGLVILDRHYGDQVGLIRAPTVKDGKLCGAVEFCEGTRAKEIAADAAKGLRCNVSVGYVAAPGAYRVEGEKDGFPVVRNTDWTPYEASFEPVPADPGVGVGRAMQTTTTENNEAGAIETPAQIEVRTMSDKKIETPESAPAPVAKRGLSGAEVGEVLELAKMHNIEQAVVSDHLRNERSVADFKDVCLVEVAKRNAAAPRANVELPPKDAKRYSLMRAIRAMAGKRPVDGIEAEASQEIAKINGRAPTGLWVPHGIFGTRDLTKSGTSSATVATNLAAGEFIELLRTNTILQALGVRFLSGLVGDIAIPKLTGGATGYWVSENSAITESTPTLGQVTGSPHTCGALVDISRRMLLQSTPDAEAFVQNEVVERIARTVQIAVFAGSGSGGQPSAITAASGINNPSVTAGTPTYTEILSFVSAIMADNATGPSMKWAMTAEVWAKLAATFTNATYGEMPLVNWANKTCLGFPYETSEDLPANSLWFGDWSKVVVGVWGSGVDINVDTSTLSNTGAVRLVALQDVDVMVRNGEALAYNTAVTS